MEFCLTIDIDKGSAPVPRWMGNGYYTDAHFDQILIEDEKIEIRGTRSKLNSLSMLLFNTNTSLYHQIIKTLSFYYLCTGDVLQIKRITLSKNGSMETETEFLQPFQKPLGNSQKMLPKELEMLFSRTRNVDLFANAIIYYIKAAQNRDFDNFWRSFNSLYSIISLSDKENEKLRDVRSFIERHTTFFPDTLAFIANDSAQDIRAFRIRDYILNEYPTRKNTKTFVEMIKRFSDIRIINVLEDTLPYRIEFIRNEGLEAEINSHISSKKINPHNDDTELLCFYILKYSYFIRNKYFHAERASPHFILRDSSELQELSRISNIFQVFLAELIRCNSIYL